MNELIKVNENMNKDKSKTDDRVVLKSPERGNIFE